MRGLFFRILDRVRVMPAPKPWPGDSIGCDQVTWIRNSNVTLRVTARMRRFARSAPRRQSLKM